MVTPKASRINFDKIGTIASAVCAVHCLLTGLAIGLISASGLGFIASKPAEYAFMGTAVVVGLVAIVHGIRQHHSAGPAVVFVLGLGIIAFGHFGAGHSHGGTSTVFSVLGGLCLVVFHVWNQRLRHQCGCGHCQTGR